MLIHLSKIDTNYLNTALQMASGGSYLEIVERLLDAEANVNADGGGGSHGRTALQAAAGGGRLDVAERLRKPGARDVWIP